jgi:phosphoserine phosphatase
MVDHSPAQNRTLLVTLTGPDRPGLTSQIFAAISPHPVDILDIEQVTARGKLTLAIVLSALPDDTMLRRGLQRVTGSLVTTLPMTFHSGVIPYLSMRA